MTRSVCNVLKLHDLKPLVYFAFEETVTPWKDSNSAATIPFAGWTLGAGLIGQAAVLSASSAMTATGHVYNFATSLSTGMTWWGWCQFTSLPASRGMQWSWTGTAGALSISPFQDATGASGFDYFGNLNSGTYNTTATPGAWIFVAVTYDAAAFQFKMYWNGALVATHPQTGSGFGTGTYQVSLDLFAPQSGNRIDEIGIWTAYAASAAQIASLYNGGTGVTWPAVGAIF